MKALCIGAALGAILWSLGPRGAPPITAAPAYLTAHGTEFDAPDSVPWDSLVPEHLRLASLDRDVARRERLYEARSDIGGTEITFLLPLPAGLAARHFYLLDSTGILPLAPDSLVGRVRIVWEDTGASIRQIRAFGTVRANVPAGRGRGFVLSSAESLRLTLLPSERTADDLLAPDGKPYPLRGTPFWEIVRQYAVTVTGAAPAGPWIWVQWRPDREAREAACEYRFMLFRPATSDTFSADDGCDV